MDLSIMGEIFTGLFSTFYTAFSSLLPFLKAVSDFERQLLLGACGGSILIVLAVKGIQKLRDSL